MGFYYGVRATREVDGGSLNLIAKNESVDLDLRELLIHRVRFILDAGGVLPVARRQLPDKLTASHHSYLHGENTGVFSKNFCRKP